MREEFQGLDKFMDALATWRPKNKRQDLSMCSWPAEMKHSYLNPRDDPRREYWWEEYLLGHAEDYLARDEHFPVVDRTGKPQALPSAQGNKCLPPSSNLLSGLTLALLPAVQEPDVYEVATEAGSVRSLVVALVRRCSLVLLVLDGRRRSANGIPASAPNKNSQTIMGSNDR